jgi:hypothetical protein
MTKSNSKRFVRAAWSLLFFQCIASAGAVAVTGWAVFHVQNLTAVQGAAAPAVTTDAAMPASTMGAPSAAPAPDVGKPAQAPVTPAPADTAAPTPAITAETALAEQVTVCQRSQRFWRVPAQAEWCDTGVEVSEGQAINVRFGEGQWSNAGPPAFRQDGIGSVLAGTWVERAPLGALVGRVGDSTFLIGSRESVVSPANGHLMLAMNDVRGTYGDNQGWLDVYIAPQ